MHAILQKWKTKSHDIGGCIMSRSCRSLCQNFQVPSQLILALGGEMRERRASSCGNDFSAGWVRSAKSISSHIFFRYYRFTIDELLTVETIFA